MTLQQTRGDHWRFFATVVIATAAIPWLVPVQAMAACGVNYEWRAGDYADTSTATGVQGFVTSPDSSQLDGFGAGAPSAADVYIFFPAGGQVQLGWYVGSAGSLPTVSRPQLFWAENTPGDTESLHSLGDLGWNTRKSYQIVYVGNGTYQMYINGSYVAQTNRNHAAAGTPSFDGESNFIGTRMYSEASAANSPYHTLQRRDSDAAWHYFTSDNRFTNKPAVFRSDPDGDNATDFAHGGGSAYC
jgi:hypothetical protein